MLWASGAQLGRQGLDLVRRQFAQRPGEAALGPGRGLAAGHDHGHIQARTDRGGAAARQCFFANDLSNWTADDKGGVVYLRIGVSDVYEVKLLGACPDLRWAERIGI